MKNESVVVIKAILVTVIFMSIIFFAILIKPKDYYWLKVVQVNDSIANVIIVNYADNPVSIVDDNIYRHTDKVRIEVLMTLFETSIGFKDPLKASEAYYQIINGKKHENKNPYYRHINAIDR